MKSAAFDYAAPESTQEAIGLLARHGEDARVLAGGQSLVPMMAMRLARFELLVDITRIDALRGVVLEDGHVSVGATTLQATALEDPAVRAHVPMLAEATEHVGHFQTRNRGTIGGALAHADPTAEYPAAAVAMGAEVVVEGPSGRRTVATDELYESAWTTALDLDEVIVASRWPRLRPGEGSAVVEVARRRGDFALAGAAAYVRVHEEGVTAARVVMFGVDERPRTVLQDALVGMDRDLTDLAGLADEASAALEPPDDVQASGAYRRLIAPSLIERAVRRAAARALGEKTT